MRRWGRRWSIGVAVIAALGGSAVAIAGQEAPPDTDEVTAKVVYNHVSAMHRECEGVDGPYAEEFVTASGPAKGDPRLSGQFTIRIHLIVNVANGVGIEEGTFTIRDPRTNQLKADGTLKDSGTAEISQGVLFGQVHDQGTGPGEETQGAGQIIANFRTTFGAGITTQIGGTTADGRIPAVIWSGECTGPFERFEGDIVDGGAAATDAPQGLSGWSRLIAR